MYQEQNSKVIIDHEIINDKDNSKSVYIKNIFEYVSAIAMIMTTS